ncbi:DNA polymerase III subunit alpha [Bacillus sp. REN10]|uniref:DNA polymerase III subunit alpha n=1 Tax=Bacillus sp. REN10 TaxID=2782541 RepID=UPI00193BA330|nr:DNA polymerase III subunit alpha [Bacillus sp. REN10]
MFTHLQIQTGYSLLSSTISIEKLMAKAKQLGYQALAITDHNVMYGVIPFYQACKKAGIKPLIGLTVDVKSEFTDDASYPLVLLAKSQAGYHHLLKISSVIQTKAKEGIPIKWLKGYSAGLFAFTPGLEGEIEGLLQKDQSKAEEVAQAFKQLFAPGHFFLSMQRHGKQGEEIVNEGMKALSKKLSIPLIATHHVSYIEKDDAFALQCLQAIRDGEKLADQMIDDHQGAYFTSQQEMETLFADEPEALQRTNEIAAACEVELSFGRALLPRFPHTEGKSAEAFLQELCIQGLEERGLAQQPAYKERLLYELNIIERMGFSDYFLIVWDFMKFARSQQILTGPGRGSAAGSLVAYVLHITSVDPLEYGLLFERFLNPERVSMPDIDLDFPDHRRDEVIHYISQKYGALHAAQIITFGTLSAKAVMRDVARVFGFSTAEMEQLSKSIPTRPGVTLKQVYKESEKFRTWVSSSANNEKLYKTALTLEGLPRHTSTHAAGMVITEQPLTELIAIQEGHDGLFLTQFPMDTLEQLGLLKIDLLGLRNLTILERILESIYYSEGKKLNLKNIPLQDHQTFQLLGKGQTTGIFQLESEGMRKVLMRLQPSHFEDIVAVNALYRPGPMEHIPAYIERKHGRTPVEYPHSHIKEILEPTYGVLIYQEQIMQIASKLAGFSLGEADLLRRAVSKKKKDVLDAERKHFVQGARRKGYSEEIADKVYHLIVQFANYGFNRSHAVAYSVIAYQLAYLKAHYPMNFMAALLTSAIGNEEKVKQYISEAKTMGIQLLPPSINESHFPFKAEKEGIRYSLAAIRGIGTSVLKAILSAREKGPFVDLFDFCLRVPLKIVNRKAIEALIASGTFDEFGQDRAVLMKSLDVAIDHVELVGPEDEGLGLFQDTHFFPKPKYVEVEPMAIQEKLTLEKEVLGVYVSAHPTKPYERMFHEFGSVPINLLVPGRRQVAIGIFVNEVRVIRTKKGENMAFVQCSDASGEIEGVLFPGVYRNTATFLQEGSILFLKGDTEERNGRKQFIVKSVQTTEELERLQEEKSKVLYVKIPHTPDEHLVLEDVHHIFQRFPGQTPIVLHYERTYQTVKLREKSWIKPSQQLITELEKVVGKECVVLK